MTSDLKQQLQSALQSIPDSDFRAGHLTLLKTLGYTSEKTIPIAGAKPAAFLEMLEANPDGDKFDKKKALFNDWTKADLLFQLTNEELSGERSLFEETDVKPGLLQSYLFFAIELNGKSTVNRTYARGKLTAIARQINRVFPMPVMVLIKHPDQGCDVLSIAVINRSTNKREQYKDVLGKVTIIRDISLSEPHPGHVDILDSFAVQNLKHPEKLPIASFDTLHTAWEEIFNVELLNERFYKELANWYFWAKPQVKFPNDIPIPQDEDGEKSRSTGLIRLLTRLIFCWFIKEKGLIPEKLFHRTDLAEILKDFDPESKSGSQYYQAILQNLFFATLNQRMGKNKKGEPFRYFVKDEGFHKNRSTHDLNNYYRYEALFQDQDTALQHFENIPFLNGGLFECLDRRIEEDSKTYYLDGFSRNTKKRPCIPNCLFFADEIKGVDLSGDDAYHDKKRRNESVSGLLRILNKYKFTIVENTPIDQEIALDPELLGKVFENLLASYNEETKSTARKQTGSFYTPRPIVDYMVDESLKSHLAQALNSKAGMPMENTNELLDILFSYTEEKYDFSEKQIEALIDAIYECKILDPACGSGAFPMGVLHKLVFILTKLDPKNEKWEQIQIREAQQIDDADERRRKITEIINNFANNEDDYGRKLYLIEKCLYGVDIQPIAIQISKLRFFISLICDQKTNRDKAKNHGIRPLPNLETKFVAADTLIGMPEMEQSLLVDPRVGEIEQGIESCYHEHFGIQHRTQKIALQRRIKELRKQLGKILSESLMAPAKAQHVADWDAFDPQSSADFFDPHWMFGKKLTDGFDVIIGNPPYISVEKFAGTPIQSKWKETFETFAARGDIYCLFYERGAQLLKDGGSLVYITSNKWMRAGYGKALRGFLSSKVDTESVLDFGMAQNFSAATTYTCITRFYKQKPDNRILSCYAKDGRAAISDPAAYFTKNAVEQPNLSEDAWVVLSQERQRIKSLVEAQGTALEKWDLQISYGIKTGFNEAFYLNEEDRDSLITEDPASADLIGKLLRGRDLERYGENWQEIYQLVIPFGAHTYLKEDYPAVYRHLCKYEEKLKARGQCKYGRVKKAKDTNKPYPGQHHWLELDNNPRGSYIDLFKTPKVLYQDIAQSLPFYFDSKEHYFFNNTLWMINGRPDLLTYVTATLNSSTFRCCFRDNFPEYSGNAYRLFAIFMQKIPIKKPTALETELFAALVLLVQFAKAKKQTGSYKFLEDLIDACVMECYFRDHMAERDLLFQQDIIPHLAAYSPDCNESMQRDFLENLVGTLNAPSSKIRNRLLRLTADSPDLLAVIKKEGKV